MNRLSKLYNSIYNNNKHVMSKWIEPFIKATIFLGGTIGIVVILYKLAAHIK